MNYTPDTSLCLIFHKTEKLLNEFFNHQLMSLGLNLHSEHWHILETLYYKGKHTQQEIADLHEKDKTHITRIVDFLENHNWVKRLSCKTDRRNKFVKLTADGKKLFSENEHNIKTAVIGEIEKHLSNEEISFLHSAISAFYEKLSEINKKVIINN